MDTSGFATIAVSAATIVSGRPATDAIIASSRFARDGDTRSGAPHVCDFRRASACSVTISPDAADILSTRLQ